MAKYRSYIEKLSLTSKYTLYKRIISNNNQLGVHNHNLDSEQSQISTTQSGLKFGLSASDA